MSLRLPWPRRSLMLSLREKAAPSWTWKDLIWASRWAEVEERWRAVAELPSSWQCA